MVPKHKAMLTKLKKQVSALKRKEKLARIKLKTALMEVKQITKTYEKKLVKKTRDAQVAAYSTLAKTIKQKAKKLKSKKRQLG
ncbi:MAG: hypothetical protein V4501_10515 [Pseudomonadota bacterium]